MGRFSFLFDEVLLEEIFNDEIEAGDHLCGVVEQLAVELLVKFLDMCALDLKQRGRLLRRKVIKLNPIGMLADNFVSFFAVLFELQKKLLDECHHLSHLDIGAIDHYTLLFHEGVM